MMGARDISKREVELAVESGELECTKTDEKGRGDEYYHSIELKEPVPRKIIVGWAYQDKDIRIITAYEVKRKWR